MSSSTLEVSAEPIDLLIALGKNIGVGSSPEDIRAAEDYLSPESRMIALAAGYLYRPGMSILFSTGHTAGMDVPSEARAVRNRTLAGFPNIPVASTILEEDSFDTPGNAQEVAKLLELRRLRARHIGLLTIGYHRRGAVTLFKRYGVDIVQSFAAEEVLIAHEPHYKDEVEAWANTPRIRQEELKEVARNILLFTIDPYGKLLRQITQRTRG